LTKKTFTNIAEKYGDDIAKYILKSKNAKQVLSELTKLFDTLTDEGKIALRNSLDKIDVDSLLKLSRANIDGIENILKLISKLDQKVIIRPADISMKEFVIIENILKESESANLNLAKINNAIFNGEERAFVKNIEIVEKVTDGNVATYNYDTNTVTFGLEYVKKIKSSEQFTELINHEFFHSATYEFNDVILNRLGFIPTSAVENQMWNEAHDLLTLKMWEKINPSNYEAIKEAYKADFFNRFPSISSLVKGDYNTEELMRALANKGAMAEWLVIDPKNADNVLNQLKDVSRVNDIFNLAEIYKDIMGII